MLFSPNVGIYEVGAMEAEDTEVKSSEGTKECKTSSGSPSSADCAPVGLLQDSPQGTVPQVGIHATRTPPFHHLASKCRSVQEGSKYR